LKVKAIADAKIKTDKIDATVLAHLLRADLVPEEAGPDHQTTGNCAIVLSVRCRRTLRGRSVLHLYRHENTNIPNDRIRSFKEAGVTLADKIGWSATFR
jgi:hypothetical protein